jgi:D-alanyl-D-alanine carboxypeptidase
MDGLKTGYIQASGFNLIASAVRDERRLIGVVFGGKTAASRNQHMADLLDRSFARLSEIRLADQAHNKNVEPSFKARSQSDESAVQETAMRDTGFDEMLGQGDYDSDMARRLSTGLMAIRVHRSAVVDNDVKPVALTTGSRSSAWSIQVGAFSDRQSTDAAIAKAARALPPPYRNAQAMIAPLRTDRGWLYRGRLTGFTREQALQACQHLRDCLPLAPQG